MGRLLVDVVDRWAAGQGAVRLVVEVRDDDERVTAFCAALGFVVDGPVVASREDPSRTWRTWVRRV